jgi:hypothetical protein
MQESPEQPTETSQQTSQQPPQITPEPPQRHGTLIVSPTYPNIGYDPREGLFWRIRSINGVATVTEIIELDIGNMVNVNMQDPLTGKRKNTNRKAAMLAWELVNGTKWPVDHVVMFKNLDCDDLTAYNIKCLPKEQYKKIKDAIDNVNGVLLMSPDPREAYRYKVRYKIKGLTSYKYFWDVTEAERFKRLVLIKSIR